MASKKSGLPGLTLVEFLIGTALIAVITLLVISVYLAHFRLYSNQTTTISLSSQNSIALKDISSAIRQSRSVAEMCCTNPTETTSENELVLQLWAIDKTTGEPLSSVYDYIIYKVDSNNNLIKRIVADPISARATDTNVATPDVSILKFKYDHDPGTTVPTTQVTVELTLARQYNQKTISNFQTVKIVLRNR